jgi:uncharacterized protein (DUF58 family)
MAQPDLNATALPAQAELQSFARAAAHLLAERQVRAPGMRVVKRKAGVGIQHLDHRDYRPGDEVRHIDWRQTARRRRPIVRQFESESVSEWVVMLDLSSSMAVNGGPKWQAAARGAAAMSYALLELGHRVGLLAFGRGVRAECRRGRGRAHYAAVIRLLGSLRPATVGQPSDLGACARRLRGDASVIVFSDFLADDEMRRDLAALLERSTSLHALQVGHARETAVTLAGEADLVDVETGERLAARLDASAATVAAAERAAMTRRLHDFCERSGIAFTAWDVQRPWQQTLIEHLARARSIC